MAARDRAVLPYERAVFNAARRAQRQIADEFKRRIRTSSKEEAGGLDLEDDDEGREVVVNGYRQLVPIFERTFRAGGVSGLSKARVNLSFDVRSPRAERLLLEAENKFFDEVSDTAWQSIKRKLSKALEEGSNIDDLTQIVESELDVGSCLPVRQKPSLGRRSSKPTIRDSKRDSVRVAWYRQRSGSLLSTTGPDRPTSSFTRRRSDSTRTSYHRVAHQVPVPVSSGPQRRIYPADVLLKRY